MVAGWWLPEGKLARKDSHTAKKLSTHIVGLEIGAGWVIVYGAEVWIIFWAGTLADNACKIGLAIVATRATMVLHRKLPHVTEFAEAGTFSSW